MLVAALPCRETAKGFQPVGSLNSSHIVDVGGAEQLSAEENKIEISVRPDDFFNTIENKIEISVRLDDLFDTIRLLAISNVVR